MNPLRDGFLSREHRIHSDSNSISIYVIFPAAIFLRSLDAEVFIMFFKFRNQFQYEWVRLMIQKYVLCVRRDEGGSPIDVGEKNIESLIKISMLICVLFNSSWSSYENSVQHELCRIIFHRWKYQILKKKRWKARLNLKFVGFGEHKLAHNVAVDEFARVLCDIFSFRLSCATNWKTLQNWKIMTGMKVTCLDWFPPFFYLWSMNLFTFFLLFSPPSLTQFPWDCGSVECESHLTEWTASYNWNRQTK